MYYFGKPTIEKIEHRLCEYLRCDFCKKKIVNKEKYFEVTTGHRDWGNDSCDSIRRSDVCVNCINECFNDHLKRNKESNTAYIEIETEIFVTNCKGYGEYDKYEDRLVEEDILEKEGDK